MAWKRYGMENKNDGKWTANWYKFITEYAIPMHNMIQKSETIRPFFKAFNKKYPRSVKMDRLVCDTVKQYPGKFFFEQLIYQNQILTLRHIVLFHLVMKC